MKSIAEINHLLAALPKEATCSGYCPDCDEVHYLTEGNSRRYALELMVKLEQHQRIDFHNQEPEPLFSTACLWGERGGQMFGVLECIDDAGKTVVLRAFSGQFNTSWQAEGWVVPAFDLEGYSQLMAKSEAAVQELTAEIESGREKAAQSKLQFEAAMASGGRAAQKDCRRQLKAALKALDLTRKNRRTYSQDMLVVFHDLYQLQNFNGTQRSIRDVFYEERGIPTGTGDCCGPKLLQAAAQKGLTPLGLSEFYFGRENKAATRFHQEFYPSCKNKCQPILGYMLCGL